MMKAYAIVEFLFSKERRLYSLPNFYDVDIGDTVLSKNKCIGKVITKGRVVPGSEEADLINTLNCNRDIEPIVGKVIWLGEEECL